MADEDELAAAHRSVEEMRAHIGATSLHYLSVDGMQAATELPEDSVCRACFTREYPTRVPPRVAKLRFEPRRSRRSITRFARDGQRLAVPEERAHASRSTACRGGGLGRQDASRANPAARCRSPRVR
jgi:hypothetical protein